MGGCASGTQKPIEQDKISSDFEPLKRFICNQDEGVFFAEMDTVMSMIINLPQDKFKKMLQTFHRMYLNSNVDPRKNFNIILLLIKLLKIFPPTHKFLIDLKIENIFTEIKLTNLQDEAVNNYNVEKEYNYWQRLTNINLELVEKLNEYYIGKKDENIFNLFINKHCSLFPRKTKYSSLCPQLKYKLEKEAKAELEEIKMLRFTAIDEVIQQLTTIDKFLPVGMLTQKYLNFSKKHQKNIILATDHDILKILQLDYLKTLLINEEEGTILLEDMYNQAENNTFTTEEFIKAYKEIAISYFPEMIKVFDELNNKAVAESEQKMKKTGCFAEFQLTPILKSPENKNCLKDSLGDIPYMNNDEFFSKENINSILEEEQKFIKENSHSDVSSFIEKISQSSISDNVRKRKKSPNVVNFTPNRKAKITTPEEDFEFNKEFIVPRKKSNRDSPPRKKSKSVTLSINKERYVDKNITDRIHKITNENNELEVLISALEEEKNICEKSLLNNSSKKISDCSNITARSFRNKRKLESVLNPTTVELQRILRDKEAMIAEMEHKYEMLKIEYEKKFSEELEFNQINFEEEPRRYAREVFNNSISAGFENSNLQNPKYYQNEGIKVLEKEKFFKELYDDIDKSLCRK